MAIATELNINSTATPMDLAAAIFGDGIVVTSATFSGDPASVGIYSGAQSTIAGIVPGDTGVILSTGLASSFTNSSGTTNTNTAPGTTQNLTNGAVDADPLLNGIAGQQTFDGAILTVTFVPDGDFLTMQFVFSSEEYPEYVGSAFNDVFGVWVNGTFVPASVTSNGEIAINTVNGGLNQNLYIDNTADQFNTEMDGFTRVLTIKAPVNIGQANTIRIGLADAGDASFDSNLLIIGNSAQTLALAFDDELQLLANSSRTFDILANDNDQTDGGLTITHLNGTPVVAGQTITLSTGEQVRLNADSTVTVFSDGNLGANTLTYSIVDSTGNTDGGFITINTIAAVTRDGIIEGTAGNDVIAAGYAGDPDGDLVDNGDALGVGGTIGDGDYVLAGAGSDSITTGAGADVIYAGADADTVFGGAGNDWASLGTGNDSFGSFGPESDGNDTVFGDAGADHINGGAGADRLHGGAGSDTLIGGPGNDSLSGDEDADTFQVQDGFGTDTVEGGESVTSGTDFDRIDLAAVTSPVTVNFSGNERGSIANADGTISFTEIEALTLTAQGDLVDASVTTLGTLIDAGAGNDTLIGGTGADTLNGGDGRDRVFGGAGDVVDGGAGGDNVDVLDLSAYRHSGTRINYTANDPTTKSGTVEFLNPAGVVTGTLAFSEIETVIACFTPGCRILTDTGDVAVENLVPGQNVLTRDNGFQPICWMARRELTMEDLRSNPSFNPVRIAKDALGEGLPARDLIVSPQHRMLMIGSRAELMFGEREVLVAATHLVGQPGIVRLAPSTQSYLHFMFEGHEVVRSDGAWSESFQPGEQTFGGLHAAQRQELLSLFPDLVGGAAFPAARLTLKAYEAAVLLRG